MKYIRSLFQFPVPFLKVFTPAWLIAMVFLIGVDLWTKKLATDNLTFIVNPHQQYHAPDLQENPDRYPAARLWWMPDIKSVPLVGENGEYLSFELVFNDRFVFGMGTSMEPGVGILVTLIATIFLMLYRWHNPELGHRFAWLFVFSGALGNMIDKAFVKSMATGEWVFSMVNLPGHISGVVDFVKAIWFGWDAVAWIPIVNMLAWEYWPTFNVADSLIVVGIIILLFTINHDELDAKESEEGAAA